MHIVSFVSNTKMYRSAGKFKIWLDFGAFAALLFCGKKFKHNFSGPLEKDYFPQF